MGCRARGSKRGKIDMKKQIPANIVDNGKVAMGGMSPSLPPVRLPAKKIADGGKVAMGGWSPSLPPVRLPAKKIADGGKVAMGGHAPSL
jgi:hypothetical protein